jgi:hypothetical protein
MFAEEPTNKSNPADVFVAVFLAEAEPFGEIRSDNVAIENLDTSAPPHEFRRNKFG